MLKIGVTGGIGSGKSTVCRIFETLGIPVYYADDEAKKIMVQDKELIRMVKSTFGEETYYSDGSLNRKYLANIVFNDNTELSKLNQLVHPRLFEHGESWFEKHSHQPYALKEAAILFESGMQHVLDKVILITASKETRIKRVMLRDDVSQSEVEARMSKQMSDEEKMKLSDFHVINNQSDFLIPQILKIHNCLLKL